MRRSLWNFICGYANMNLKGQHVERFIRICCARDICLHNLVVVGDQISFSVDYAMVDLLHQIADKCGCQLSDVSIHGRPVFLRIAYGSVGLLLGIAMAVLLFFLGTSFVTRVEIEGNVNISDGDLLSFLETQGIRPGALKYGVQDQHISNQLLMEDPRVSWAEFDIDGTVATLKVAEANYIYGRPDHTISDIVASRDGYIVGITCLAGHSVVSAGQAVYQGQLLVSHFVSDMEQSVVNAKAVVLAIVWDTYTQVMPSGTPDEEVWEMLRSRIASEHEGMSYTIVNNSIIRGVDEDEYTIVVETTTNIAETRYIEGALFYDGNGEDIH